MQVNRFALAQRLGISGLYLFAVSGSLSQGGVYAGLGLMLLGVLLTPGRAWKDLRGEPLALLALVLTLYILVRGAGTLAAWPDQPQGRILRNIWDLAAIGGLFSLLTGWWLAGNPRRIALVLQLAVLGLFLGVLKGIDWRHFDATMTLRPLFGMGNGAGLYSLVAMTGMLILWSSPLFAGGWQQRLAPWIDRSVLVLLFATFTAVFLVSQTRAAWLAALLVLPVVGILLARAARGRARRLTSFGIILLGVILLAVTLGAGIIEKRLDTEQGSLALVLAGRLSDLPPDSIGLRVRLWEDAGQRIAEKPLFGWGAGSAPLLIRAAGLREDLTHYHNLYLQLGVELGALGLVLFAAWTLAVAAAAVATWRARRSGFDYLLFLLACMAIVVIVSGFQIRHDDEKGQYLLILIGALALTHRLCGRRAVGA